MSDILETMRPHGPSMTLNLISSWSLNQALQVDEAENFIAKSFQQASYDKNSSRGNNSVDKPWPGRLTKIINYLNYLAASDWLQTPA